ncbi:MAG: hypothetical protein LBU43_11000 [Candidatus Accumulibacter sp.]|jgi:hypothetical protein|nr:hypothetical protein [Accumulibacter sp.]
MPFPQEFRDDSIFVELKIFPFFRATVGGGDQLIQFRRTSANFSGASIMSYSGFFRWRCPIAICLALALPACAGYDGRDLKPGESRLADVVESMGTPAMRWKYPDGREQLAYPRGPAATQTFMAFIAPDGRLERIEMVLDDARFARIQSGDDMDSVLRLLGPTTSPRNDVYFKARDERVWSWLFCDGLGQEAYFDVLFDGATGIARTTQRRPNYVGWDGAVPSCGH